ncbi:MAG: exopolysaccharide biosynthesis protein [Pseudomonadota bacterium]
MVREPASDSGIADVLEAMTADIDETNVSLGWILDGLNERAFGLFLLILALPCCVPFLYGVPQIVALPLLFVAGQIVVGRSVPWLPRRLRERQIAVSSLRGLATKARPTLARVETLSRPRLAALTRPPADRLVGLALVLFSASILVPLPGTNTVPGFAVMLISMGMLQRDGLLVIVGSVLGTAWIATLVIAGATLATVLRAWITG